MNPNLDYLEINKKSWNRKTDIHIESDFYDNENFLKGKSSLNKIELDLFPELKGKKVLHLQCHFGQDTISMARLGADVTGVDLSDQAVKRARELAAKVAVEARFICCDVYDLPNQLEDEFDVVFTSYGTIGWLPDMNKWAGVISHFLKPGGKLVFAEFHPVVWMFDDDFTKVGYNYFNSGPIVETQEGTYANVDAKINEEYVMWNHGIGEVVSSLIANGMTIDSLKEYDYSPYPCFKHVEEFEEGKYRVKHLKNDIPMVYSIVAKRISNK